MEHLKNPVPYTVNPFFIIDKVEPKYSLLSATKYINNVNSLIWHRLSEVNKQLYEAVLNVLKLYDDKGHVRTLLIIKNSNVCRPDNKPILLTGAQQPVIGKRHKQSDFHWRIG